MNILTPAQKSQFEKDGFLVLSDFASSDECDALIKEAGHLVDGFEPDEVAAIFSTKNQEKLTTPYFLNSGNKIAFFFEPQALSPEGKLKQDKSLSLCKIGHALHAVNPVFKQFSTKPVFNRIFQEVNSPDAKPQLVQSMYIFKQPRIGGEVVCHQDATFLYTEPVTTLGFWFALEDAHQGNGCLFALPGGHHGGLKRRFVRTPDDQVSYQELDTTPWPKTGYVPLEAKKGTLILLHGLLPHLSGPNLSDQSRHAYAIHIIDRNAHYPEDNWLKPY